MGAAPPTGLRNRLAHTPRLLVVIVSLLLVLLLILWGVTRLITAGTFADLETRDVREGSARAQSALDNISSSLGRTASDYALWDDAYAFAIGSYPEFLADNAIPESMDNLSIDFMAVVRPGAATDEGSLVMSGGGVGPLPSSVLGSLDSSAITGVYDPVDEAGSGVLLTDQGTYLFATSPITDSEGIKRAGAYLAVGRLLDERVVQEVRNLSRLRVRIAATSTVAALPDEARASLQESSSAVVLVPAGPRWVTGNKFITSVDGAPAALMTVTMPRTVQLLGARTMDLLRYALLSFGLVACLSVAHVISLQHREVVRREEAEEAMRASEQRHRNLIERMADAVVGVAPDGTVVLANPQATRLTGLDQQQLVGSSVSAIMTPESWDRMIRKLEMGSLGGLADSFGVDIVHTSGKAIPVEINSSPMTHEDGSVWGMQWIARDVTDQRRFEQELVHLANRDHLTGLYNRRRFEEELAREVGHASRTGRNGALLWLDIDCFKDINDSLGHQAGDQVLVGVAATATSHLRADSFIARLGGDEFAVLLSDTDRAQAEECAERLTTAVRDASCLFEGRSLRVTSSMGVVLFPDDGTTVEELLARADLAMYRAKEAGRNQFVVYESGAGWHDEQRVRFDWSTQIERALRDDLFIVYAQPVVSIADGTIDRHELLIRMEGEDGSILPPASFLHVAERTGQIHQIDRWMVRRAIDLISMQAGRDESFRLDVNLSGRAFSDSELLQTIESELIRTDIAPSSFGVEITETAAVSDMSKARAFIARLRSLGCRVSLDDFGSGFSSFYYLKNLPIDCLKIDGSFIQNMASNLQDQHVVKAMVELSEGFGISSTAEFVEDETTLDMLRSFGVTYAQGYHISRPMPVADISRHTNRRTADGLGETE